MSDEEILSRCPLFEGMEEEALDMMLGCLGTRTSFFKKNDAILAEGEPARQVGILLSGRVELIRSDYLGNRSIMASLGPGQLFGEAFACAQVEALPVSAVAAEDCRVMLMDIGRMLTTCSHACEFHRQMVFNLLKIVARKNLALHRKAEIVSHRSTREKVLAYLAEVARETGKNEFTIPFDRQGLADYLEVDRSGLSAELSKLKKEGLMEYEKNWFRLQ